jgi:hypothetical protein
MIMASFVSFAFINSVVCCSVSTTLHASFFALSRHFLLCALLLARVVATGSGKNTDG